MNLVPHVIRACWLAVWLIPGAAPAAVPAAEAGWQPPAFEITTESGMPFHYPDDLKGPTIVLFWATWCPYCKALMPHLQSILDEYGEAVEVVALNFREDADPQAFLDRYGFEFQLLPGAEAVAEAWGVKGTPGLFLTDGQGRVIFSRGAIPPEAYAAQRFAGFDDLGHTQKAARVTPLWAARLRAALDELIGTGQ